MSAGEVCDVLVVGGGPAGLSAAVRLKERGVRSVVVVERENEAGGVPRHCLHSPFGMREFHRVLAGPAYARRLVETALRAGVELRTGTSVVAVERGDALRVILTSDRGTEVVVARRLLLATGARETPRSARLVSGDRPLGVLNTGALQAYALKGLVPFRRPLIVGSELVSLSALLTCRGIGARPVMMVEERDRPLARTPFMLLPRLLGVPLHLGARVLDIRGGARVEEVTIGLADGSTRDVACDGVLFTGRFTPESSLARAADVDVDPGTGGPAIDQFGRTGDARIFAAGNLLRPIETAGWCWSEGRTIGGFVADDLAGRLPPADAGVAVKAGPDLAYVVPQRVVPGAPGLAEFQMRVRQAREGRLIVSHGGTVDAGGRRSLAPERRLLRPIPDIAAGDGPISVEAGD